MVDKETSAYRACELAKSNAPGHSHHKVKFTTPHGESKWLTITCSEFESVVAVLTDETETEQ